MSKALYVRGQPKPLLLLTEQELADLENLLEEESTRDRDYYIDDTVLGFMESKGASARLIRALTRALADKREERKLSAYREPGDRAPAAAEPPEEEGDGIDVEWRDVEDPA